MDLYTGSFGGVVYVLYGEGERQFKTPEVLLSATGDPLAVGQFYDRVAKEFRGRRGAKSPSAHMLSGSMVAWDEDGDLDLVAGERDGRILLFSNEGSKTEPKFSPEPEKIRAGRKALWVRSGHSMPVAKDWDGDGLFDIISGSSDGAVFYWRNTGKAGAPAFAKPVTLLEDPSPSEATGLLEPARPMTRTQPHIGDLDGDGKPELLIGESRRVKDGEGSAKWHGLVWAYAGVAQAD